MTNQLGSKSQSITFENFKFSVSSWVGPSKKSKIPQKYLSNLVILPLIWHPQIQECRNMSIVIKPWNFVPMKFNDFTVPQLTYWQTFCPTIWNGIMSDKRLDFTLRHNAQRHLDQSEDWILCVLLVTRTCNVWRNKLSRNAPFGKISNSALCGRIALILWRLVKGSFFCVF